MEEIYIQNVKNGIRAIRLGVKTPIESKVAINLNKLKPLNEGMYEDLLKQYKIVLNEYKSK